MRRWIFLIVIMMMQVKSDAQQLVLADRGKPVASIVPGKDTAIAGILQDYIQRSTGAKLPVRQTALESSIRLERDTSLAPDAYTIAVKENGLIITGGNGKGLLYAVYTFLEHVIGARKWDEGPAVVPHVIRLSVPATMYIAERPAFRYREVYLPASKDEEYLNWHKLQRFEEVWGLWGHSFFKLVPPAVYFREHPEYYSLINGVRRAEQLCLSNEDVLQIAIAHLEKAIKENPAATYWSISANDGAEHCECDQCKAVDQAEGGPQGSLIRFVNAIAARFPGKQFTTLAYLHTARPTLHIRPLQNVHIMLSSIDAYRHQPLKETTSFRNNLEGWRAKTKNILVWDYITQFTNYLAPFPDIHTLQPNMQYFRDYDVEGVFSQGSGYTYSDMAALKSYVTAKLLWNPSLQADQLIREFLAGYYGKAAPFIQQYLQLQLEALKQSKAKLDIYGNPVNEHDTYLSPYWMDRYSNLMDAAEVAVEGNALLEQRVRTIRLSQEYTYLQQARFYGKRPHGIFDAEGKMRSGLSAKISRFTKDAVAAGVTGLSEGGMNIPAYQNEWKQIIAAGARQNLAQPSAITLQYPHVPEYPANGPATLTDGVPGYSDFSYNWLLFYGQPMIAIINLGALKDVQKISMRFLEDPRHWIFRPAQVSIEVSDNGTDYMKISEKTDTIGEEDYNVSYIPFAGTVNKKIQYIRVTAVPFAALPTWRYSTRKKVMIACDEIWVD